MFHVNQQHSPRIAAHLLLLVAVFAQGTALAAVLPEDRSELLYHSYEGGGVTINGPSVLVRKQFAETVSVWGNYYVDMVSSASLDVLTQGSAYTEERTETGGGIDYLHDRTTMSLSYTRSIETDYEASTVGIGISQEFFGDLSTLTLGYSQGNDTVMRNGDENFSEPAQHQRFSLGFTQILTKNWIMSFSAETVSDTGFLNNAYRQVRLSQVGGLSTPFESYPTTHNSDAYALRSMYYLPYRAALRAEVRTYTDSWGVKSNNYELRYIHPYKDQWIFETKYRAYSQNQADFYASVFTEPREFMASDKEMSAFSDFTLGLGASYEVKADWASVFDKLTLNLYWDYMSFDYDNYPNKTPENTQEFGLGNEPAYSFSANVIRFFVSVWY